MEDWLRKAIEDGLAADAREREEEAARHADWKKTSRIDWAEQQFRGFGIGACRYQYLWPERVWNHRLPWPDAYWRRKARKLVILAGRMQRHPAHAEAMAGLQADGNADRAAVINLLRLASTCDVDETESTMRQLLTRPDGFSLGEKTVIRFRLIHLLPGEIMRAVTEAAAAADREDAAPSLPPTFLGLTVDPGRRTIQREGHHHVVDLSGKHAIWCVFAAIFGAMPDGATTEQLEKAHPGEGSDSVYTAVSSLRNELLPISLTVSKRGNRKLTERDPGAI